MPAFIGRKANFNDWQVLTKLEIDNTMALLIFVTKNTSNA